MLYGIEWKYRELQNPVKIYNCVQDSVFTGYLIIKHGDLYIAYKANMEKRELVWKKICTYAKKTHEKLKIKS